MRAGRGALPAHADPVETDPDLAAADADYAAARNAIVARRTGSANVLSLPVAGRPLRAPRSDAFADHDGRRLVSEPTIVGMIDASQTRSPSMPCTRKLASTTACASFPMRQVPIGWYEVSPVLRTCSSSASSSAAAGPGLRFAHDVLGERRLRGNFPDHAQRREHRIHVVLVRIDSSRGSPDVWMRPDAHVHRAARFRPQHVGADGKARRCESSPIGQRCCAPGGCPRNGCSPSTTGEAGT